MAPKFRWLSRLSLLLPLLLDLTAAERLVVNLDDQDALAGAEAKVQIDANGNAIHLYEASDHTTAEETDQLRLFLSSPSLPKKKQRSSNASSSFLEGSELPDKVLKWFAGEGVGLDEVELWDVEDVRWFFQKIGRAKSARKMADGKIDGPGLLALLKEYKEEEMAKYEIKSEAAWNDIRLELWARFHKNEEDPSETWEQASHPDGYLSDQDRCPICSEFEIAHTFGFEWALFPTPSPWPNPIHTWICDPLKWEDDDVDDVPSNASVMPTHETGKNATDYAGKAVSKSRVIFKAAEKAGQRVFFEPVKTLLRCSLCGLCVLWEKLKAPLGNLGNKWRKFLATAKDENKYAYRQEYDRLRMSLFQTFSIVDKKRDGTPLDTSFLQDATASDLSSAQLAAAGNKLLADCWKLVDHSEALAYEALDRQMLHMVLPAEQPEVSEEAFRPQNVPASLYQGGDSVHMVPKDCQSKFDPRKNFKKYRSAFSWGLNVEMPNLSDAFRSLVTGQWITMIEALIPEVLLMVVPVSHKLDECISGQKEAKEQVSVTCTPPHLGMCNTAMKYQLLTEMVEAEWPPLESPGWWKRRKITKALTHKVDQTCVAIKDFKKWKKARLATLPSSAAKVEDEEAVVEEARLSQEFEDCRVIKQKVHDVDFTESGVALYGPKIWFGAAQAWFLQNYNKDQSGEATFQGVGEPKIENFVHQFCSALLHCDTKPEEEKFNWNHMLSSYDSAEQASNEPNVELRKQMYEFWGAKLEKESLKFDRSDRTALQGLGETFKDQIKPLFMEYLDLDRNPFVPPPPMEPVLTELWYKDIKVKEIGIPKLDVFKWFHRRWIYIDSTVEQGCAMFSTMHEKGDTTECNTKCVEKRTKKDLLCLMDCDNSEECETYDDKTRDFCRECLSVKKSFLVDYLQDRTNIQGKAYHSLYEMDHPVQTENGAQVSGGVNKYVVLHGYFETITSQHWSHLRQIWVTPILKKSGANAKWQWISRVLKTARDAGACPCMNEKLREYIDERPCANTLWLDGTDPVCVSKESTVPGALCWSEEKMKRLMFSMQGKQGLKGNQFINAIGCFPNVQFEDSQKQCASVGMTAVPIDSETAKNSVKMFRSKVKLDSPDDPWSVETLVSRIREVKPADDEAAARVEAGLNCLEKIDGIATVPLIFDTRFRVWTSDSDQKLPSDTGDLSGSFKVDFDYCRKKSFLEAQEHGDENPLEEEALAPALAMAEK